MTYLNQEKQGNLRGINSSPGHIISLHVKLLLLAGLYFMITGCATCKYATHDPVGIPPDVKTFRVNYFENHANYVNPQITPQVTEKLKQKIIGQTRLRQVNSDDAHYDITGYLTDYSVTTTGITNQTASINRLNVSFHLTFKNTLEPEKEPVQTDISRSYDFDAQLSLTQAETKLLTDIIRNLVEEIFNKIFVNW